MTVFSAAEWAREIAVKPCADNRASEHSAGDVSSVDAARLERAARITVAWLAGP